jgi:hypothetical protein
MLLLCSIPGTACKGKYPQSAPQLCYHLPDKVRIYIIKDLPGHIKEPKGVDFVIASHPLTDKSRQEISEFICICKNKTTPKKRNSNKTTTKRSKPSHA